jgi:hypothetical protein
MSNKSALNGEATFNDDNGDDDKFSAYNKEFAASDDKEFGA